MLIGPVWGGNSGSHTRPDQSQGRHEKKSSEQISIEFVCGLLREGKKTGYISAIGGRGIEKNIKAKIIVRPQKERCWLWRCLVVGLGHGCF